MSVPKLLSLLLAAALLGLTACGGREAVKPEAPKTAAEFFPIRIGERVVRVQIAALPAEQERGLMHRQALGADEGMLFVFPRPQGMGFWMKNTVIPLDIGYIDPTGELKEIYPLHPRDERTVTSRSRNIQFCLEMNQGWFRQAGVGPGAKLDLQAVAAALRARGLKPEAAGLR